MIIIFGFMACIILAGAILFYKTKGNRKQEKVERVSQVAQRARTSGCDDD